MHGTNQIIGIGRLNFELSTGGVWHTCSSVALAVVKAVRFVSGVLFVYVGASHCVNSKSPCLINQRRSWKKFFER